MNECYFNPKKKNTCCIYISYIINLIFLIINGNFNQLLWGTSKDSHIWFFSGAFLIVLGKYIAEPFFTKPTDSIANTTAIIITLISLNDKQGLFGYTFILVTSLSVLFFSLLTIFLKNIDSNNDNINRLNNFSFTVSSKIGNSKVLFSLVYVSSILSYFAFTDSPNIIDLILLLTFWICLVFFDIIGKIVEVFSSIIKSTEIQEEELGQAIGCENPLLYQVEIDYLKHKNANVKIGDLVTIENQKLTKSLGLIINKKQLLNKLWLEIYLLVDEDDEIIKMNQSHRLIYSSAKTILRSLNSVKKLISLDSLPEIVRNKVLNSKLYSKKENFVGYIENGSNINQIIFQHLGANQINEGEIVYTDIYGEETLYQLIDGQTREESLEFMDGYGYEVAFARKIGYYDYEAKELNSRKWLPKIYSPVFLFKNEFDEDDLNHIADNSIGRLPETSLQIPIKDYDSLVTHNTAILGILGIGKSCLTFELLKKINDNLENIKIICVDITNEYALPNKLPKYISNDLIISDDSTAFNVINKHFNNIYSDPNNKQYPDKSGNQLHYRDEIKKDLLNFFFNQEDFPEELIFSKNKKVRIYNPDLHKSSKGEKIGYNVITTPMSQTEKTRIITEEILKILMHYPATESKKAKVLIVFEEAHSLIPEWNSVANEGDKSAVNGTAKVILQGRKYGLGSLVITQRTANISKSILNQCNTIFALRVFDDTGKQFLENYIGSDYSNLLPTLEERHAIAIGKGLRLKQPVVVQLNDLNRVINK